MDAACLSEDKFFGAFRELGLDSDGGSMSAVKGVTRAKGLDGGLIGGDLSPGETGFKVLFCGRERGEGACDGRRDVLPDLAGGIMTEADEEWATGPWVTIDGLLALLPSSKLRLPVNSISGVVELKPENDLDRGRGALTLGKKFARGSGLFVDATGPSRDFSLSSSVTGAAGAVGAAEDGEASGGNDSPAVLGGEEVVGMTTAVAVEE